MALLISNILVYLKCGCGFQLVMAFIGCERSGRSGPPKIHPKAVPRKRLLYFFIVVPGQWLV